jgi:hypothetical protein
MSCGQYQLNKKQEIRLQILNTWQNDIPAKDKQKHDIPAKDKQKRRTRYLDTSIDVVREKQPSLDTN